MGILGGPIGYRVLRWWSSDGETGYGDGSAYALCHKLEVLLGPKIWDALKDKSVIDFGCGSGADAVEVARRGAKSVVGLDIRESLLSEAREKAQHAGVAESCSFVTETKEKADVILSVDTFEHFHEPAAVLKAMRKLVNDEGCVIAVFGPPWYHPLGGHLFSVFPWAHLIFTERALIRWRSDFKTDGATHFNEVEGGLNQMTIRRFRKLVAESGFRLAEFETVPIRKLRPLANYLTREFTTAIVRCKLALR